MPVSMPDEENSLVRWYRDLSITFNPSGFNFHVDWGQYGEDDEHQEAFDSLEAAKAEIDKVLSSKRAKLRLSTSLPVIYVTQASRWDRRPAAVAKGTLIGLNKGTSNLMLKGVKNESFHAPDVYPDTQWVWDMILKRDEVQKELNRYDALLRRIEINGGSGRIDDDEYQAKFDKMVADHAAALAKAQQYEIAMPNDLAVTEED